MAHIEPPTAMGWRCPGCGAVWSPTTTGCLNCTGIGPGNPFFLTDDDIARARMTFSPATLCPTPSLPGHGTGCTCIGYQGVVDLLAKGHLGTPCPKPQDGGMCGCDEGEPEGPQDCYRTRCSC
jgi:hypothetical protein